MTRPSKPQLAFAVGLALLVLSAAAAGITIFELNATVKRAAHAQDVEATLADLESTFSSAGRAETGYVTSGDTSFLDQYNALTAQLPAKLDHIRDMIPDIPTHHDFYVRLALLSHQRLALMSASVEQEKTGQNDVAMQAELSRQRINVADEMRLLFQQMESHEQQFSDRRQIISNLLFIVILSLLFVTFAISVTLLYLNYRLLRSELAERRRAEQEALESQASLRLLSARLLRVQDEERRRFSRELHDSLGQYLNLIKMNLSALSDGQPASGRLAESLQYLERCITETRTISYLLHPPLLDEMGFVFAAKWYLDGFAQRSNIRVETEIPDDIGRLPEPVELALFRVLQECLTNIHRHSGSSRAEISVEKSRAEVVLRIQDHGSGIPSDMLERFRTTGAQVGVGLAGMRERVREQGGQLDVRSSRAGTTVTARIPFVKTASARQNATSASQI